MEDWNKDDTFIFVILGDQANKCALSYRVGDNKGSVMNPQPSLETKEETIEKTQNKEKAKMKTTKNSQGCDADEVIKKNPNTKKYLQYYLTSHGILIRKLAIEYLGIPEENVKVFACGSSQEFEVCNLTDNKSIVQLDFDPLQFFITKHSVEKNEFEYFQTAEKITQKILKCLKTRENPRVMVFLDDHGTTNSFGSLSLLKIYQMLIEDKPKSIRIFNDSCYSQSMIDIIGYFNDLIERISGIEDLIINDVLSIYRLALQMKTGNDDQKLLFAKETIDFFNSLNNNCEKKSLFAKTIKDCWQFHFYFNDYYYYRNPKINSNSSVEDFIELVLKKYGNSTTAYSMSIFDGLKIQLPMIGIKTYGDYRRLCQLYSSYKDKSKEKAYILSFADFASAYNDVSFLNAESIFRAKDISLSKLTVQIEILIDQNLDNLDSRLQNSRPFDDVKIFTSAPRGGSGITFPSIRINGDTKIVAGSPAMGAFIKEAFLHFVPDEISDKPVIDAVFGDEREHIEFPTPWVPNAQHGISQMWVWLDINKLYSKETSNERLFTTDQLKSNQSVKAVLERIGYEEYKISERDAERIRFRRVSTPVKYEEYGSLMELPVYDIEESDEYYDSEDEYVSGMEDHIPGDILSSGSETEDERIRVPISQDKIKKLQKMFPLTGMWEHDVISVWKYLFAKRVVKQFEFEFGPELSAYARPGLHNFRRSYMKINQYFSASSLGWEYNLLGPQIDGLLNQCDSYDLIEKILDLIGYCFDDADRVVTPLYYTYKKTINPR